MFKVIMYFVFSISQTLYAWHMLNCPQHHSPILAFFFTLFVGAFWIVGFLAFVKNTTTREKI